MTRTFLMTLWEGGGVLPPMLGVARRLIARGHTVHVLADPTVEDDALAAGCSFAPWTTAPARTSLDPSEDPMKDWEVSNPLVMLRRARDYMIAGPAPDYAADTRAEVRRVRPDAVLAEVHLVGAMIGAQAEGVPVIPMIPNIWDVPVEGMPAFGPGFAPPRSAFARGRNRLLMAMVNRIFDGALPSLNETRADHGLLPLDSVYDQVLDNAGIIVLTSPTFDFSSTFAPEHATYVGPVLDDPHWANVDWKSPFADDDDRPLVLVGLSSTFQDQAPLLRRIVEALTGLDVRAVVTLGQMLEPDAVTGTDDVVVVPFAPHSELLVEASAVVTHCGHGITMKTLAAGVPMVCIPMGRDQNDNAARVVHQGAGVRLKPSADADRIRSAVDSVLTDGRYRDAAERMARVLADEAASIDVADAVESTFARKSTSA